MIKTLLSCHFKISEILRTLFFLARKFFSYGGHFKTLSQNKRHSPKIWNLSIQRNSKSVHRNLCRTELVCRTRLKVLILSVNLHITLIRRAVAFFATLTHVIVFWYDISWRELFLRLFHAHKPDEHEYD